MVYAALFMVWVWINQESEWNTTSVSVCFLTVAAMGWLLSQPCCTAFATPSATPPQHAPSSCPFLMLSLPSLTIPSNCELEKPCVPLSFLFQVSCQSSEKSNKHTCYEILQHKVQSPRMLAKLKFSQACPTSWRCKYDIIMYKLCTGGLCNKLRRLLPPEKGS